MGRAWTEAQVDYLRRNYNRLGPVACAHSPVLQGRSVHAIRTKAQRLGLYFHINPPEGYVLASVVGAEAGMPYDQLIFQAMVRETLRLWVEALSWRYLRRRARWIPPLPLLLQIKRAWVVHERLAAAYIEQMGRYRAAVAAGYLSSLEAARYLGLHRVSLLRGLEGRGAYGDLLRTIKHVYSPGGWLAVEPYSLERARIGIEKRKRAVLERGTPVKVLAAEAGCHLASIHDRLAVRKIPVQQIVHRGRRMAFALVEGAGEANA
ncbi:hypothetical protein [Meiothermus sp. Pnk-1]|uniref:hypothetical protein n=1 Tax=Meiothermus sp. Pnk-1 TaxID=873128 RepID=UPI000D7C168A|nr:hypothetical protein [Meiothermus sp. Pnk-1]PZA08271.1 hypothetical protein DNA98_03795 [Meiothermus sp. Pnk-1]